MALISEGFEILGPRLHGMLPLQRRSWLVDGDLEQSGAIEAQLFHLKLMK